MLLATLLLGFASPTLSQTDLLVSPLPRILPEHTVAFQESVDRANVLLLAQMSADEVEDEVAPDHGGISERRAFLYSVILPGAGQFKAGSRKRGALFFSLEVISLGMYLSLNGEGNDLEDDFRLRADEEWNPWDYLGWRGSRNSRFSSITHALPCSAWVASAPSTTPVPNAIADCPERDVQQYYELIGKYDQFISGWDDVVDADGNRVTASQVDSAENFRSELRLSYEVDRNDSNKLLKRATNVAGLILVNHVISAIDAARVARARREGQSEATVSRRTRLAFNLGGTSGRTPMLTAFRLVD